VGLKACIWTLCALLDDSWQLAFLGSLGSLESEEITETASRNPCCLRSYFRHRVSADLRKESMLWTSRYTRATRRSINHRALHFRIFTCQMRKLKLLIVIIAALDKDIRAAQGRATASISNTSFRKPMDVSKRVTKVTQSSTGNESIVSPLQVMYEGDPAKNGHQDSSYLHRAS
jgi:hypothetical protein